MPEGVPQMCALKLARRILPDSPNHKLATVVEYLGIDLGENAQFHSAACDVAATVEVLRALSSARDMSLFDMFEYVNTPEEPTKMPFGKHKGSCLTKLPGSYVRWLLELENLDDGLRSALEKI
jgi:DNA polymerase III epsilon subunit-like protein